MLQIKKITISFKKRNLIFVILGILAFLWVPFDAIDLSRYYAHANKINTDLPLIFFIISNFVVSFDFIYYLLFYGCKEFNIPIQTVTGISVGLLYHQAFVFVDNIQYKYKIEIRKKDNYLLKTFILFSVSFITVFGISRNVTALLFFAFGANNLITKNVFKAMIFFSLAIFTHIGLIIYLTIFMVGYYWESICISNIAIRRIFLIMISILGLSSFIIMQQILPIFNYFPFFSKFAYYTQYLDTSIAGNIFGFKLGIGDIIPFISSALTLLYPLLFIKKQNPIISICYLSYIWLIISMGFSQMFTQRTILYLILLQGATGIFFFSEQNSPYIKSIYRLILLISIFAFFLNVYSYRGNWIFKLP